MVLLGGAYLGQIFCFKNQCKNQQNETLVQNYSSCLISISLLYVIDFKKYRKRSQMLRSEKRGRDSGLNIYIYIYIYMYSKEMEIRQLLWFCTRISFVWFLLGFLKQNIWPKYSPPRRTNYTLELRGSEAAPPMYFISTPSRRAIFW